MLSKVPRPNIPSTLVSAPQEMLDLSQSPMSGEDVMGTAANSLGSSSWNTTGFDITGQEFHVDNHAPSDSDSADPLNTLFSESDNIDWVSLKGS